MIINKIMIVSGIFLILSDLVFNIMNKPITFGYLDKIIIIFGFCFLSYGIAYEKSVMIFRKIDELFESKPYYILFFILIISLLIRLLILPERWINPDEGAHLYDAKFILDGKIPYRDYGSRMPFYVYSIAALLKIFECNYIYGRLLPLFANIGIGILIFLIGMKLFNNYKIALLALIIYLFSPISIIWSVVVKTELPETFLICAGMYLLFSFIRSENENNYFLFFSGFCFALAYYVRRSAIVILVASLLIILYFYRNDIYKIIKNYSLILLGYSFVICIIFIYFSNFIGFNAVWDSPLNPLDTIKEPIQKIAGISTETTTSETIINDTSNQLHQSYDRTLLNWKWTLKLNSFIFFGILLFFLLVVYNNITKRNSEMFENNQTSLLFLWFWVISIFIFYIYYSINNSYYNQYFGELLPVLSLILAFTIYFIINEKKSNEMVNNYCGLISIVLIALYLLSISLIGISYECVWSPDTINEVSDYIDSHSQENDIVMSGAVIWTFETNTKPFMNISHPLHYLYTVSKDEKNEIEYQIEYNKPDFIILDGYTEKTYLKHIEKISEVMNESYILTNEVNGSKYPVKIYEIKTDNEQKHQSLTTSI